MERRLLLISPWSDDWEIHQVKGNPETAYTLSGLLLEPGVVIDLLIPRDKEFAPRPMVVGRLHIHPYPLPSLPRPRKIGVFFGLLEYLLLNITLLTAGVRLMRCHEYRLIYGLSSSVGLAVWWLGRRFRIPTVLKLFGIGGLAPFRWYAPRSLVEFPTLLAYHLPVTRLVVKDDGTLGDEVAERFRVPGHRLLFWRNPVEKGWAKLKPSSKGKVILAVARLVRSKGLDVILKAMRLIVQEEPDASLLILGEGREREGLVRLIRALGLDGRVRFLGAVPYQEMPRYYQVARVVVGANRLSNLTRPVEEAMVCGVPVVATDVRATAKVVRDGLTGFLVPPGDPRAMAEKVVMLLRDPSLHLKLSRGAREFAKRYFPDWKERIEEERELIRSLGV